MQQASPESVTVPSWFGQTPSHEVAAAPSNLMPSQTSSFTLDVFDTDADTISTIGSCTVHPISPSMFGRYERNIAIPWTDSRHIIQPFTTVYSPPDAPPGWISITHPEGGLYFFQQERRILTDAYLYDTDVLETIADCICQLDRVLQTEEAILPFDVDLVLDLTLGVGGEAMCGYYYADHQHRTVFWLEAFDASTLLEEVKGVSALAHIGHEIESQYWTHWELFPNIRRLSSELVREVREMIVYSIGDSVTSSTSTAPYNSAILKEMLEVVNHLTVDVGNRSGHSACVFGRLMTIFVHQRFLHFHGQKGARLNRDQTVHGTDRQPSWLFRTLLPVLLYAPSVHLQELVKIWVDELVGHVHWNTFIDKLITEWREYALYSALLLNSNVGLLAMASEGTGRAETGSPAQTAGWLSLAASVCAIVTSLLLLRQYRTKDRRVATEAGAILSGQRLETLAVVYSLPYVCLLWGLITFILAVSFMCYEKTDIVPRPLVGILSLALACAVLCSIGITWDSASSGRGRHWHWLSGVWKALKCRSRPGASRDESRQLQYWQLV